jgi:hypothetical protein
VLASRQLAAFQLAGGPAFTLTGEATPPTYAILEAPGRDAPLAVLQSAATVLGRSSDTHVREYATALAVRERATDSKLGYEADVQLRGPTLAQLTARELDAAIHQRQLDAGVVTRASDTNIRGYDTAASVTPRGTDAVLEDETDAALSGG